MAVIGLGLVGQLVAQLARLQGGVVVAIDLKQDRVELARQLGAQHAMVGGSSTQEAVHSLTAGRGADCVIVAAAAKSSAPCQQALQITRDREYGMVGAVEMASRGGMYARIQLFMRAPIGQH